LNQKKQQQHLLKFSNQIIESCIWKINRFCFYLSDRYTVFFIKCRKRKIYRCVFIFQLD
jgi:hypothetical protein